MWPLHPDWIKSAEHAFNELWQHYKEIDVGKEALVLYLEDRSRVDFLDEFLQDYDDDELLQSTLDWQCTIAGQQAQRQLDEIQDFMNATDTIMTSCQDSVAF